MSQAFSHKKTVGEIERTFPTLTPIQRSTLDQLGAYVNGQIGRGAPVYEGELVSGASPLQQQAFGLAAGYGSDVATRNRQLAISQILSGQPAWTSIDADPYVETFNTAVEAPAMRAFSQTIIPQILQAYGAGGPSGAVVDSLGEYGATLATNLGAQRAQTVDQWLARADQNRLAGAQLSADETLRPISLAMGLGEVERGIRNEQLGAEFGRWESGQAWANPALGLIPSVLGTQAFDTFYQPSYSYKEPTLLAGILKGLSPSSGLGGLLGRG